jgi:hypothetical protein
MNARWPYPLSYKIAAIILGWLIVAIELRGLIIAWHWVKAL